MLGGTEGETESAYFFQASLLNKAREREDVEGKGLGFFFLKGHAKGATVRLAEESRRHFLELHSRRYFDVMKHAASRNS